MDTQAINKNMNPQIEQSKSDINMTQKTFFAHNQDPHYDYLVYLYDWLESRINKLRFDNAQQTIPPLMQRNYSVDASTSYTDFRTAVDFFDKRAFLMAEKGYGKTITLLNYTRDAVIERLRDSKQALPIYAAIWRWNPHSKSSLAQFLAAQTPLPEKTIQETIDSGNALLLLDGLDELGTQRKDMTKQSGSHFDPRLRFLENVPDNCPVIIAGRRNDYQQLQHLMKLKGAITLERIFPADMQKYLEESNTTVNLWQSIKQSPRLMAVLRSPLLLSMFAYAYNESVDDIIQPGDKNAAEIRDAIFEDYVVRRYQDVMNLYNGKVPFPLQRTISILGMAAARGVIRYGTGQVVFVEINEQKNDSRWQDFLAVKDLAFGFTNFESPFGDEFMHLAAQLHLVNCPDDGIGSCTFIHTVVRDFLVIKNCLPISQKLDSYTIESLSLISDTRKYDAFAEILLGDFKLNYKLQAFAALENDPSDKSTETMIALSKTLEHPFFSDEIRKSIDFRAGRQSGQV